MTQTDDDRARISQSAGKLLCGPQSSETTEAYRMFIENEHRTVHFIGRIFQFATRLDETLDILSSSLNTERTEFFDYSSMVMRDHDIIEEILTTRTVDSFLTYISRLISTLFHQKPEILQTTIDVQLSDILRLPDRETIIQHAVDGYVQKLTFQSLRDLYRDIKNRCNFRLFESESTLSFAVEAVSIRNAFVHNGGLIDAKLARDIPRFHGKEKERIFGFNAMDVVNHLSLAVSDIDSRARRLWDLPPGTSSVEQTCRIMYSKADHEEHKKNHHPEH